MTEVQNEEKNTIDTPVIKEAEVTQAPKTTPIRQIIIETDGDNINLIKAEVSGTIELIGILQGLISYITQSRQSKS